MTLAIALDVAAAGWRTLPEIEALVGRALDHACLRCGVAPAEGAEVSVLLCNDAAVRALNREWRGLDKATNVLSFPAPGPVHTRQLLGDIAVAWETTRDEAADGDRPVADHLAHLLVHGFLHLVGQDHEADHEAEAMERLETSILADLGIADPYEDSEPVEHAAP